MINSFCKRFNEFVEILFVQKDFVPVIPVIIKSFPAFRDGEIVVVPTGSSYIEEISPSLPCSYTLAVYAFHPFVIVFVRHSC